MAERDALAEIRHFTSPDAHHWADHGATGIAGWSGSVAMVRGKMVLSYTDKGIDQRLRMATYDGKTFVPTQRPILDPKTRRAEPAALGYDLGAGDGYVPGFRDPYVTRAADGTWHMLFAAKQRTSHGVPVAAVGHATTRDPLPSAMQPTQVRPIRFLDGRPTISFPDAPWNADDPY